MQTQEDDITVLSKVHAPGFISSVVSSLKWDFRSTSLIIRSSFAEPFLYCDFYCYADDILLTGSDIVDIVKAKEYLKTQFVTKNMGKPRYFFGD